MGYRSLLVITTLIWIFKKFLFIYDSHREREREAETQAEGEAGSMHREPAVGFDPGSPGSRPGPKAGAKALRHPGIPEFYSFLTARYYSTCGLSIHRWMDVWLASALGLYEYRGHEHSCTNLYVDVCLHFSRVYP